MSPEPKPENSKILKMSEPGALKFRINFETRVISSVPEDTPPPPEDQPCPDLGTHDSKD